MPTEIHQLTPDDLPRIRELMRIFGEAFGEPETFAARPPSDDYFRRLLGGESFIALIPVPPPGS